MEENIKTNEEMIENEEVIDENLEGSDDSNSNLGVFVGGMLAGGLLAYAVGGAVKKTAGFVRRKIRERKERKNAPKLNETNEPIDVEYVESEDSKEEETNE